MAQRRRRLRALALFTSVLWLIAGSANAAALGTCPEHDHLGQADSGEAALPDGQDGAAKGHAGRQAAPGHQDTAGHGSKGSAESHASASVAHGSHTDDGACMCDALCGMGSTGAAGLESAVPTVVSESEPEDVPEIPVATESVPVALLPHFLPPSLGPPTA